jgi:hypothetical protein
MEIFLNLWNNWSNTEKIYILALFLILFVLIPLIVRVITKSNELFTFTMASLISSALIVLTSIWFLNVIFSVTIEYIFLLTPIIILFVNILNIGTCVGYYRLHSKSKGFNYSMVKKEYIRDSIQLSIFILLSFSALSVFLTSTFLIFILLTGAISLAVVWINYALLYWLVK